MISMKKQKEIAIEMWKYIKAQIMQHEPIYSITFTKTLWLKLNHPNIQWKNSCLLCDIYLHPCIIDGCKTTMYELACPNCPLSKKYKGQASYGCSRYEDTPWSKVVSYEEDRDAAIEACDEIIAVIKELPVSIGEQL